MWSRRASLRFAVGFEVNFIWLSCSLTQRSLGSPKFSPQFAKVRYSSPQFVTIRHRSPHTRVAQFAEPLGAPNGKTITKTNNKLFSAKRKTRGKKERRSTKRCVVLLCVCCWRATEPASEQASGM